MILSDRSIQELIDSGGLHIDPYKPEHLQPASLDLTLSRDFQIPETQVMANGMLAAINPTGPIDHFFRKMIFDDERMTGLFLKPQEFVLASTVETISLFNPLLVARCEGRSSWARLGITIHKTAGFIDPGFSGKLTLEIVNHNPSPVILPFDSRICQIVFELVDKVPNHLYGDKELGSKYQFQNSATISRINQDKEHDIYGPGPGNADVSPNDPGDSNDQNSPEEVG